MILQSACVDFLSCSVLNTPYFCTSVVNYGSFYNITISQIYPVESIFTTTAENLPAIVQLKSNCPAGGCEGTPHRMTFDGDDFVV